MILESFLKNGLLLVPETIIYKREKNDRHETPENYYITQSRFCITGIDISELKSHEKYFGGFHIEFKNENAYALGAIPVFYLPRTDPDTIEWPLKTLAASYVFRLFELQNLCRDIQTFWELAENTTDREEIPLKRFDKDRKLTQLRTVEAKQLRDMLEVLVFNLIPKNEATDKEHNIGLRMESMLGALQGMGSLFYPPDKEYGEELYYFRQREWRIIAGICIDGKQLDQELDEVQKEFIRSIDPVFFEKTIICANKEERRLIDECTLMPSVIYETKPQSMQKPAEKELKSIPVQKLVERIIVPKVALEDAQKIAKENNFDESLIVDFEAAMELAALELEHEAVKKQQRIQLLRFAKTMAEQKEQIKTNPKGVSL